MARDASIGTGSGVSWRGKWVSVRCWQLDGRSLGEVRSPILFKEGEEIIRIYIYLETCVFVFIGTGLTRDILSCLFPAAYSPGRCGGNTGQQCPGDA